MFSPAVPSAQWGNFLPNMNIVDLTKNYQENVLHNQNFEAYFRSAPTLFEHYFTFWGDQKMFKPILTEEQTKTKKDLIVSRIKNIEQKLERLGFDLTMIDLVLFVGQNTSNGHALKDGDRRVVWIPIEGYETPQQADVFVTHEILHAIHYARRPEFFFSTREEKNHVGRQVLTEGIATFLTMQALMCDEKTALWADYLPATRVEKWMKGCEAELPKLRRFVLEHWDNTSPENGLFAANDPNDLYYYRAGYFAGVRLMKEIANRKHLSPQQLVDLPRQTIAEWAQQILREKNSDHMG
jgi:hypothetical protein